MCLITKQAEPKIATNNIEIYKQVDRCANQEFVKSIYFDFLWELNRQYETAINKADVVFTDIEFFDGLSCHHYFSNEILGGGKHKQILAMKEMNLNMFNRGFHSCNSLERCLKPCNSYKHSIVKGFIPKGAEYLEDETGLIVSNKLVLTEIVQ